MEFYTRLVFSVFQCIQYNEWIFEGWLGGVVVSGLEIERSWVQLPASAVHHQATTLGKLLTPMCLCLQAVQFGTGQRAVMFCGREGNRRSGVALAMGHRL